MNNTKNINLKLTVLIRNSSPVRHLNDVPTLRTVIIDLTEEQNKQLALNYTDSLGEKRFYEEISQCILETKINKEASSPNLISPTSKRKDEVINYKEADIILYTLKSLPRSSAIDFCAKFKIERVRLLLKKDLEASLSFLSQEAAKYGII